MAKIVETGHAKNVANFYHLVLICSALGTKFNPVSPKLSLAAMNQLHQDANSVIKALDTSRGNYVQVIKQRKTLFDGLSSLSTRIIRSLRPLGLNAGVIENLKGISRKIQGKGKAKSSESNTATTTTNTANTTTNAPTTTTNTANSTAIDTEANKISVSQMSFDSRLANFQKMIEVLKADPNYKPNEVELNVLSLEAYLAQLQSGNMAAAMAGNEYIRGRQNRNQVLYLQDGNLHDTAMSLKDYLLSVLGSTSVEYKQARKIKFAKRI